MSKIPDGSIIIAACKDDCVTNLSQKVKSFFKAMGSINIDNLPYRHGFTFIGVSGNTQQCHEKMALKVKDQVYLTQVFNLP